LEIQKGTNLSELAAEELSAAIREMSGIANALKKSTGEMREGVDHFKVR
jgi:methyl-accepting chemotaxis protein